MPRACRQAVGTTASTTLALDHAQPNSVGSGLAEVMFENLAPQGTLDVVKRAMLSAKNFTQWRDVSLARPCF